MDSKNLRVDDALWDAADALARMTGTRRSRKVRELLEGWVLEELAAAAGSGVDREKLPAPARRYLAARQLDFASMAPPRRPAEDLPAGGLDQERYPPLTRLPAPANSRPGRFGRREVTAAGAA